MRRAKCYVCKTKCWVLRYGRLDLCRKHLQGAEGPGRVRTLRQKLGHEL